MAQVRKLLDCVQGKIKIEKRPMAPGISSHRFIVQVPISVSYENDRGVDNSGCSNLNPINLQGRGPLSSMPEMSAVFEPSIPIKVKSSPSNTNSNEQLLSDGVIASGLPGILNTSE